MPCRDEYSDPFVSDIFARIVIRIPSGIRPAMVINMSSPAQEGTRKIE
jgi:hypothetical protein